MSFKLKIYYVGFQCFDSDYFLQKVSSLHYVLMESSFFKLSFIAKFEAQ